MSLGQKIIDTIENHRDRQLKSQLGAVGKFWRDGGNSLLLDMPVTTGSYVIDGGGYQGEWTSGMITRYGCKSQVFEPVPAFAESCKTCFKHNSLVQIHQVALGCADRKIALNFFENGTSEFRFNASPDQQIDADVVDIARIFDYIAGRVACLKLNIEGGEYDVLERMLQTHNVDLCDSLLIQFHRQPEGYEERYKNIITALHNTHIHSWCYEMVWEKWVRKGGE